MAAENNTKPSCQNPASKGPVILATGEKYLDADDFNAGGIYGLGLTRRYHSKAATSSMFGPKWVGTYDYARLTLSGCNRLPDYPGYCFPQTIKFTDAEGATYTYTRSSNGAYTIRGALSAGTFYYDPDGEQIYRIKGGQAHYYDLTGKIRLIQWDGTKSLSFTYGGPYGALSAVTNRVGQTVQFNWSNGLVTSIVDTGGNTWTYGYTAAGMLASVTAPGANPDIRTYLYENADSTLLTGIAINGSRFSTYSYDANKRVSQSAHSDGAGNAW